MRPPIPSKKGQKSELLFTVTEHQLFTNDIMGESMLLNQAESTPRKPRKWPALTCPVCGFRFPPRKFNPTMKQILYPVQIVTGGGRAKGFHVEEYIPWEALPKLQQTDIWPSLLCLYTRLASAYDHFYEVLGFLSPEISKILHELQKSYADAYGANPIHDYSYAYTKTQSLPCLLYTSPSPRDRTRSRMPSSA